MKVLLILEATLGGTSRHILDLADGLMERGMEVHFVYSMLRADQQFLTGLASLRATHPGLHCHSIPITREVTFSDISAYLKLSRYVRDHGPFDVIHAHSTKAGFLTRLLFTRNRIIYTPHGLMTLDPALTGVRRLAVRLLESILAYRSKVIVAVSDTERCVVIQTGIRASKLVVIPNGIRLIPPETQARSRKILRDSLSLPPDMVCIGFVSRFTPLKKPERVIDAFALLRRRTASKVRLAMIGWGPLETQLRHMASRLGIGADVDFLGEVDGAAHMPAFDILAHTSSFEGFGYVFVEALSAGVPIVSTRVGGTAELVSDGVTGYVCDPWDADTFADYLRLLVENPQRRAAMAVAARERAAGYTVAKMVDSIAELYGRLCAQPDIAPVVPAGYESLPGNSK